MRILDWGGKKREFTSIDFDPTGALIVACGGYDRFCVWDVATGDLRGRWLYKYYRPLQFHPLTGHVLELTNSGVQVYDPLTWAPLGVFAAGLNITTSAFEPSGEWYVCCHSLEPRQTFLSAFRWSGAADETSLWRVPIGDAPNESGYSSHLACLGDGERFLSAEYVWGENPISRRYRVAIRSREDGRLLQSSGKIFGYGARVFGSHLSDAVIVMDGIWLRIHSIDNLAAPPRVLKNDNKKHFTGVAFHPSGRYLAATSNDATVKLYDTTTWEVARTFTWDIGRMRSIAFSPDGALAAAGSDTGKVVVWDVDL
jgi:WD40 repeat protein